MKHYEWTVHGSDALSHTVTLDTDFRANRFDITIDGTPFPVETNRRHYYMGFAKHTLPVAGKTCHLMAWGTKADLAADGKFLICGLPYVPYPPIPKFTGTFMILCALTSLFGAVPGLVGVAGCIYCFRTATDPFLPKPTKRKRCGNAAAIAWGVAVVAALIHLFSM